MRPELRRGSGGGGDTLVGGPVFVGTAVVDRWGEETVVGGSAVLGRAVFAVFTVGRLGGKAASCGGGASPPPAPSTLALPFSLLELPEECFFSILLTPLLLLLLLYCLLSLSRSSLSTDAPDSRGREVTDAVRHSSMDRSEDVAVVWPSTLVAERDLRRSRLLIAIFFTIILER